LGLRRLALVTDRPRSFSSVSMIPVLAERGLLDASLRDRLLVDLAIRNYLAVRPSSGLLLAALHRAPPLSAGELGLVFAALWRQGVSPAFSAATIGLVCRVVATEAVRIVSPSRVTELALEAVGSRIPRPLAARLVERAASETLRLLPSELEAVRRVCVAFSRV
jgi:hypothetical protein